MLPISALRVVGTAAVLLLAGCAGSSSLAPSEQSLAVQSSKRVAAGYRVLPGPSVSGPIVAQAISPARGSGYVRRSVSKTLYVADVENNRVLLYDPSTPNPSPIGMITTGVNAPAGLAVDKNGTLYVVNAGNQTVTEYPAGQTTPKFTITSGMPSPYGIGVDSKLKVFVSNTSGSVNGYKPGQTSPFERIFDVGVNPVGVAVDSKNDVYVADDSTNTIYVIPAGASTAHNSGLTGLDGPIGLAFEQYDTLFVANYLNSSVGIYLKGSTSPSGTITTGLNGPTLDGFAKPGTFFQSNQGNGDVLGYKTNQTSPFSTITGIPRPLGIASFPKEKV